jgi:thymidylate kinase
MTAIDATIPPPEHQSSSPESPRSALQPDGEMLRRVFEVLDRDGLAYCVTHAYAQFPQHVEHDVDCVVPREMLPRRLGELLKNSEHLIGGRIVQWFEERANFIVLQAQETSPKTGGPAMLQLHVSSDFEVKNRVVASGNDILATRRSFLERFWVPAPHVEFACILANRVDKRSFDAAHTRQLSALWASSPVKCAEQLERLFRPPSVALIGASALRNEWEPVIAILAALRREMMIKLIAAQPFSYLCRVADKYVRRIKRWSRPRPRRAGLHVVFLGPDGVGKSTVIEAVQKQLAPAFLRTNYQTFARGILGIRKKASPHALPPRSLPASLIKAAWWLACYTAGYYKSVYPTLVRGGLVVNHRYLLDAIVDPRRYRYSGPINLLRAIWRVSPKPDLVIVLDAPAEVIHARKEETTLEETIRQRHAYLGLAAQTPNAHVVDSSQSPEQTIEQVTGILLDHMAAGVARRLKLK